MALSNKIDLTFDQSITLGLGNIALSAGDKMAISQNGVVNTLTFDAAAAGDVDVTVDKPDVTFVPPQKTAVVKDHIGWVADNDGENPTAYISLVFSEGITLSTVLGTDITFNAGSTGAVASGTIQKIGVMEYRIILSTPATETGNAAVGLTNVPAHRKYYKTGETSKVEVLSQSVTVDAQDINVSFVSAEAYFD